MSKLNDLRKGDIIIDFGLAYRVTNVTGSNTDKDNDQARVHYQPAFVSEDNHDIAYSIPLKNISLTNKRRPVSVEVMKNLLSWFNKNQEFSSQVDLNDCKDVLNSNDIQQVVEVAKQLTWEQQKTEGPMVNSKREILDQAISQITQEIAVVFNVSLNKARSMMVL